MDATDLVPETINPIGHGDHNKRLCTNNMYFYVFVSSQHNDLTPAAEGKGLAWNVKRNIIKIVAYII